MQNLLCRDGEVYYYPYFLDPSECVFYYQIFVNKVKWQQQKIKLFGKTYLCPRLSAWYGDADAEYTYSGILNKPEKWFSELETLKRKIEAFCKHTFNSVLINWYRNEKDSMGWHSDDEPELGLNPVIASVSLGQPRVFKFRHRFDKTLKLSICLENGSLLVMKGACQHYWEHAIPKQTKSCQGRINLTFRKVVSLS